MWNNIVISVIICGITLTKCDCISNVTNSKLPNSTMSPCKNFEESSVWHEGIIGNSSNDHQQREQQHNRNFFNDDYWRKSSVIYGLIATASKTELNDKCFKELAIIGDGIRKKDVWAIKVLDASGSPNSGFIWGNNYWMGSSKGCEAVQSQLKLTYSKRYPRIMKDNLLTTVAPFDIEYRMVHAKHESPWQFEMKFLGERYLHIGLCAPKSCSNQEIGNLTQKYLDNFNMEFQNIYEFSVKILQTKNLQLSDEFYHRPSVKISFFILLFTLAMTALAIWENRKNLDKQNNNETVSDRYDQPQKGHMLENEHFNINTNKEEFQLIRKVINEQSSLYHRIVNCFSITQNIKELLSTKAPSNSILAINGLRSIVCFWILSFHMNWFMHYTVSNSAIMFHYGEKLYYLYISNAPLLVDVFFTISGFLLSYNFLRDKRKIEEIQNNGLFQNVKLFGRMLFHRYIRLSTLYIAVILFGEVSTAYLNDVSQFFIYERNDLLCQRHWWRNVLYIQNLFDADQLCLNFTWSLACEMQYFIIFTALSFCYAKYREMAKKIFIFFAGFILLSSLFLKFKYEFMPTFDVIYNTGTQLYIAPWARIHPYISGVFAGWLLTSRNGKFSLSRKTVRIIWTSCIIFFVITLFSTIERNMHFLAASVLLSFGRFILGLSISWIIIASITGYGGIMNTIFQSPIFLHVSKLSYGIYLLNPVTITLIYGLKHESTHVDPAAWTLSTIGMMVIVYCLSFVFSLFFEIPYQNLSSVLLQKRSPAISKIK